jgi:hypothetical protein
MIHHSNDGLVLASASRIVRKNRLSRYLHSFLESEVLPPNTPLSQSINMC